MGSLSELVVELEQNLLVGDEHAREVLMAFNAPQALLGISETLDAVSDYIARGFSIVPQRAGEKRPLVKWKRYQAVHPEVAELYDWFRYCPSAGPAVVLGTISNLFVIDVDGAEAEAELRGRLGRIPRAPKVISGSGELSRFHLYFCHPGIASKAKSTPWHPQLEFRGQGGIVVMPPSRHKSGNAYRWARGLSLRDLEPPPLPDEVVAELSSIGSRVPRWPRHPAVNQVALLHVVPGVTRSTRVFLAGRYANGPDWNGRLFRAACDLAGCGVSLADALPKLLAGAQPWDVREEASAVATINSAYACPREPARRFASATSKIFRKT